MQQLLLLLLAALATGTIWAWSHVTRRIRSRQPLWSSEAQDHAGHGFIDLLLTFMLWAGGQVAAGRVVARLHGITEPTTLGELPLEAQGAILLGSSLATGLALLASIAWIGRGWTSNSCWVAWTTSNWTADVRAGSIAFLLFAPLVYGIQLILSLWFKTRHPLIELVEEQPPMPFLLLAGLSALVVAPIAEEYFFRHLLQGWLQRVARYRRLDESLLFAARRAQESGPPDTALLDGREDDLGERPDLPNGTAHQENPYTAPTGASSRVAAAGTMEISPYPSWPVFVSATLFALVHYSHGPAPIPLFLFAVGLGYLYQRTNRLLPCIVMHLLLNACSLVMLVLTTNLP